MSMHPQALMRAISTRCLFTKWGTRSLWRVDQTNHSLSIGQAIHESSQIQQVPLRTFSVPPTYQLQTQQQTFHLQCLWTIGCTSALPCPIGSCLTLLNVSRLVLQLE